MDNIEIILVDDEKDLLIDLGDFFSDYGLKAFSNPLDALDFLQNHSCDIIITDYKMPGMSGLELLIEAKKEDLYSDAILLTAYSDKIILEEAINKQLISRIVDKPAHPDELKNVLDSLIKEVKKKKSRSQNFELLSLQYKLGHNIIGFDKGLNYIIEKSRKIAHLKLSVLITGETGTGKEVIARLIHFMSNRKDNNFIAVNCASIPDELLASELFGHKKGAFTGAERDKIGKIQLADKGTLFLDEIGEMKYKHQSDLLRVLQEKKITRIGENKEIPVDFRLIAATNIDLEEAIREKKFREDLFYRINTIPIHMPKLSDRKEDIEDLIRYYLHKFCDENQIRKPQLTREVIDFLKNKNWPGNIRELMNVVIRGVIACDGREKFKIEDFSSRHFSSGNLSDEFEKAITVLRDVVINRKYTLKEIEILILYSIFTYFDKNIKKAVERTEIPKDRFYNAKRIFKHHFDEMSVRI